MPALAGLLFRLTSISHQTCILGQHVWTRNDFETFRNSTPILTYITRLKTVLTISFYSDIYLRVFQKNLFSNLKIIHLKKFLAG